MKYIDAEKLIAEIERRRLSNRYIDTEGYENELLEIIDSLQQEQPDVDLEQLKNKAELIANEIMMGVQANKYHTCIYNKASNDFNHSHLLRAALKGMEVGLNARKEGAK